MLRSTCSYRSSSFYYSSSSSSSSSGSRTVLVLAVTGTSDLNQRTWGAVPGLGREIGKLRPRHHRIGTKMRPAATSGTIHRSRTPRQERRGTVPAEAWAMRKEPTRDQAVVEAMRSIVATAAAALIVESDRELREPQAVTIFPITHGQRSPRPTSAQRGTPTSLFSPRPKCSR